NEDRAPGKLRPENLGHHRRQPEPRHAAERAADRDAEVGPPHGCLLSLGTRDGQQKTRPAAGFGRTPTAVTVGVISPIGLWTGAVSGNSIPIDTRGCCRAAAASIQDRMTRSCWAPPVIPLPHRGGGDFRRRAGGPISA